MQTLYLILECVHVLAACAWLGGGFVMEVIGLRLGKNPDREHLEQFFQIAHFVSPRVFMPAAIVTFLSGLSLVYLGGAFWKDLWIVIALTGVILTILIGATQIGPTVAKIDSLLKSAGDAEAIQRLARRLNTVTRIDLALLVLVLLDMVLKPQL